MNNSENNIYTTKKLSMQIENNCSNFFFPVKLKCQELTKKRMLTQYHIAY